MKRIPLTQGQFALVDDEDFERINAHKWYAYWNKLGRTFYARRNSPDGKGKQRTVLMHRVVLDSPECFDVDHINHDTLDNRRSNLRNCTAQQNLANEKMLSVNTSGYKGVSWHKRIGKWMARLRFKGEDIHIGYFTNAREAAIAYDISALKHFGEFALTNHKLGLLQ